jgi:beta propeller repeat protein
MEGIMKSGKSTGVFLILLIFSLLSLQIVAGWGEFKIVVKRRDQTEVAIHNTFVVWQDYRNMRNDVFGHDLSTGEEYHLGMYAQYPAVYGDRVVWAHPESGDVLIQGYMLSSGTSFELFTSSSPLKEHLQIWGDIVIWVHWNHDRDIYGYDLSTGEEILIAAHLNEQNNPYIHENLVVWQDKRDFNWDIYLFDLSTLEEQYIAGPGNQTTPSVYEDYVVWTDDRGGNEDIFGHDLSTGEEFQITTDSHSQRNPSIYGDLVVWEDNRHGTWDIYGYVVSRAQEFPLIIASGDQQNPVLSDTVLVWEDNRHGTWDIYGYIFPAHPLDRDEDGHLYPEDCNDQDPSINPGMEELCDWIDNDCDDQTDEYCTGHMEILVVSNGKKLEDARVYLNGIYQGPTDSQGKYLLYDLEILQSHGVSVQAEDYYTQNKILKAEKGKKIVVVFEMEPESFLRPLLMAMICASAVFLLLFYMWIDWRKRRKFILSLFRNPKPPSRSKETCPLCKKDIKKSWTVCPYCGANLEKTQVYEDETRVY